MPATLTDVQIASLALVELGQPAISSFSETSKGALTMRVLYEPTVLELLNEHPWRFAQKREILSAVEDEAPPFEFDNACLLPPDFVNVVRVNDNIDKFKRAGKHLLVNDTAPELTYTARVTEDYFTPGFVTALAARLTMRGVVRITDNASALEKFAQIYQAKLADAKMSDAMDGAPDDPPMGGYDIARL